MDPKVTFVVPCYKLAHLLSECVSSILDQTYANFELLIMDDCSPDNASEIAASFTDPRIKYIRISGIYKITTRESPRPEANISG